MCGITGILKSANDRGQTDSSLDTRLNEIVARMTRALAHRGPDDQGVQIIVNAESLIALGHTRLSILDLSQAGHQPMLDPSTGNWITYNGEIYNYRELRQELGDPPGGWRSKTDTEVILRPMPGGAMHV